MTFKGKRIDGDIAGKFKLIGDLTIRGTTREVSLDVTAEGGGPDPWGNERLGFSVTATINRQEFGLRWNQLLEGGGLTVSNEIKIIVNTEIFHPAK